VAESLEELWVSYNLISSLDGLSSLVNLTTLYISNNMIKSWAELDKIVSDSRSLSGFVRAALDSAAVWQASLPKLRDILLVGNPIYEGLSRDDARLEVLRHLPNLQKIDGDMVTPIEKVRPTARKLVSGRLDVATDACTSVPLASQEKALGISSDG
jgi:dynein light chain 1, axonemal